MILDSSTQRELIDLLAPLMQSERESRQMLEGVFGAGFPALQAIAWTGAAESFVLRVAEAL